ncbi:MAG: ParA family protein [Clostridia bacterium]|nr:ParA family protein [Clostridia bacterium]MBQ7879681.1 ParA family protein [Clostridia bacterium]
MSKTKVIAFANNKGGSGKTTTCSNVGCALAMMGKKVLLIDGDMQLNLTLSFFDDERALGFAQSGKNIYTAVKEEKPLSDFIVETEYENLDLVPSTSLMSSIEFDLFTKWQREVILKKCLEPVRAKGYYDYILIDAPPTLGGWVMNILCASDYVVIPVEASPWGLFGLANIFEFVDHVRKITPELKIMGVAITKADERKNYLKQTVETLNETDGVNLFETYIRVDSAVEWAQDNFKPVVAYRKNSRSATEYTNLAKEIMQYATR